MLDTLQKIDVAMLRWIEQNLHASWLDLPMQVASGLRYFVPFIVLGIVYLVWRGGPGGRRVVLASLVLVIVTDQLSASILKPWLGRSRPYSERFGLPSSHATNMFGQAVLFASYYPRVTVPAFAIAGIVGFSRVYLGKHYPFDVLLGAAVGALCGVVVVAVSRRYVDEIDRVWRWLSRGKLPQA